MFEWETESDRVCGTAIKRLETIGQVAIARRGEEFHRVDEEALIGGFDQGNRRLRFKTRDHLK